MSPNRHQRRAAAALQRHQPARLHLAPAMRPGDPDIVACSGHEGAMVLRADEDDPTCPVCGASLCDDCKAKRAARKQAN